MSEPEELEGGYLRRSPQDTKTDSNLIDEQGQDNRHSSSPGEFESTIEGLQGTYGNQLVGVALSGEATSGLELNLATQMGAAVSNLGGWAQDTAESNQAMCRAMRHATAQPGQSPAALQAPKNLGTGGSPLPEAVRARMEAAMGHDFSHVRVHTDGAAQKASRDIQAHAFTTGSHIYFGSGEYQPGTTDGDRLLAHELTHVIQHDEGRLSLPDKDQSVSMPTDPSEVEAYANEGRVLSALQTVDAAMEDVLGEPQMSPLMGSAQIVGMVQDCAEVHAAPETGAGEVQRMSWFREDDSLVGDALDLRENEDELDSWEDYEVSNKEYEAFVARQHKVEFFQSDSGIGFFDAVYDPGGGVLTVTVKCRFAFVSGSSTAPYAQGANPSDLEWTEEQMTSFEENWLRQTSSFWSSGKHAFYCQQDWWEDLSAIVTVRFVSVESGEHYICDVTKVPSGAPSPRSSVSTGRMGLGGPEPGHGTYDSEDLALKNGMGGQTGAIHEAGHMLGLDDKYSGACSGEPSHSGMGAGGVKCADDMTIMSGGSELTPEHGVTFLAALKKATDMDQWDFQKKAPRTVPSKASN